MKRVVLCAVFLFALFLGEAKAAPTLHYYSPQNGTFSAEAVTFKWTINSWETVKKVVLVVQGFQSGGDKRYNRRFEFDGDKAKRMSHTVTDLFPKGQFGWGLEIHTTEGAGTFGLGMIGEFQTK